MAVPPAEDAMQGKDVPALGVGLPELARLAKLLKGLVEDAEASRSQVLGSVADEPESEESGCGPSEVQNTGGGGQGPLAEVQELQAALAERVAAKAGGGEASPRALPAAVEQITGLLGETLHLAALQVEQQQVLVSRLVRAQALERQQEERADRAEAACATAEADAGQGEKAHELLENTLSRLTAARKSLKEREWELGEARRRLEKLEEERDENIKRNRLLETRLERASASNANATRGAEQPADEPEQPDTGHQVEIIGRLRVAEAALDCAERSKNKAQMSGEQRASALEQQLAEALGSAQALEAKLAEAAERAEEEGRRAAELQARLAEAAERAEADGQRSGQLGPLRAQLEQALGGAEDLGRQLAETRRSGERRCEELEQQLEAAAGRAEELEGRLAEVVSAAAAAAAAAAEAERPSPGLEPLAEEGEEEEEPADTVPPLGAIPRLAMPSLGLDTDRFAAVREEQQREAYVEGVGILTPRTMAKPTPRTSLRTSLSKRGGVGLTPSPTASPPQARRPRRSTGSAGSSASSEASTGSSMPMDLRALGKLLTGGGLVGKRSPPPPPKPAPAE